MEPIEERKIKIADGYRLALHQQWVGETSFLPFWAISTSHTERELLDWLTATDLIIADLQWLLQLSCHVFWSHLIFDDGLRTNLDTFLKLSPRGIDGGYRDPVLASQMKQLYELYFKVFVRMTTCKESANDYFTPQIFGVILYDNFILDLPKIIDLCVIFSPSNQQLLKKMVGNVFKHQPKYLGDVNTAVPSVVKLFTDTADRLTDNKLTVPRGLSAPNPETSTADVDILDLCLYASDLCHSIHSFLWVYPPASEPFHTPDVYKMLGVFYEDVLQRLLEQLGTAKLSEADEKMAYKRLKLAQDDTVQLFRHILFTSTLGKLQSEPCDSALHQFYDVLTESLGESRFIGHYSSMYPFDDDVAFISRIKMVSDNTRQSFIRDGLKLARSQRDTMEAAELVHSEVTERRASPPPPQQAPPTEPLGAACASPSTTLHGAAEEATAVQDVLDFFPHLGAGFVEMCLRHYHTTELVINAILEDNLPPSLASLDRDLAIAPEEDSLVTSRRNVFDNDEFDVFRHRAVDASKVHKGKRGHQLSSTDNSTKEKIRELVHSYDELSLEEGGSAGAFTFDDSLYDDEYDDTYDTNEVGAGDADEPLELMGRRMVVPVALGGSGLMEANEADTEFPLPANNAANTNQFRPQSDQPKYDVKGRAKGQGQSADVTKNRNFKTAHKARQGNHNRKAGARSKMSKGMF